MYTEEIDTISDIRNNPKYREMSVSQAPRPTDESQAPAFAVVGRTGTWPTQPVTMEVAAA